MAAVSRPWWTRFYCTSGVIDSKNDNAGLSMSDRDFRLR